MLPVSAAGPDEDGTMCLVVCRRLALLVNRAAALDARVQHFETVLQLGLLAEFVNKLCLWTVGAGRYNFKLCWPSAVSGQRGKQFFASALKLKHLGFGLGRKAQHAVFPCGADATQKMLARHVAPGLWPVGAKIAKGGPVAYGLILLPGLALRSRSRWTCYRRSCTSASYKRALALILLRLTRIILGYIDLAQMVWRSADCI